VMAMANTSPVTDTSERAEHIAELGRQHGHAQVIPVGAITAGLAGDQPVDMAGMHTCRAAVSMFSDDGQCVQSAAVMREALRRVAAFDGVIAQHAQDSSLAGPTACCHEGSVSTQLDLPGWPAVAESVIIARDVQLARDTGARLHICHLTTPEGLEVVRWAKSRGIRVTAEVTPHHLLLTTPEVTTGDTRYKVNPPLRPESTVELLREGLADGSIDCVGTDHAPHTPSDKDKPFPLAKPGMIGLEQALGVIIETMVRPGRLDWSQVAERMSHAPARLAGLTQQGRPLAPGEPANLVLINPEKQGLVDQEASSSLGHNNPYHGRHLPDPVVATWWQGRQTWSR